MLPSEEWREFLLRAPDCPGEPERPHPHISLRPAGMTEHTPSCELVSNRTKFSRRRICKPAQSSLQRCFGGVDAISGQLFNIPGFRELPGTS